MSKKCPICGGEEFLVTAHVTQGWKVDSDGNFLECIAECEETTHAPDNDDIWSCALCGYSDAGSAFEPEHPGFEETKVVNGRTILTRNIFIDHKLSATISRYLNASKRKDYQDEDETIIRTAKFSDGYQMDIKCCGCQDEASYTEAVLFDQNGYELRSEVGEDFLGEWTLSHGGKDYVVNVMVSPYITEDRLNEAYQKGIVKLVVSPNGDGIVARIGKSWFCFGGQTAEEYNDPKKYKADMDRKEILQDILQVLETFRRSASFQEAEEYAYYANYIQARLEAPHKAKR